MADPVIPEEAIAAVASLLHGRATRNLERQTAERVLATAYPFLREQWEKELLSDEAIARYMAVGHRDSTDDTGLTVFERIREQVRRGFRAALGEEGAS